MSTQDASFAVSPVPSAAPFWVSLTLVPLALIGAVYGGWTVFLLPIYTWHGYSKKGTKKNE